VAPEQHPGRDGEVKGQLGEVEQAREAGDSLNGVLHVRLGEEMERAFQRDEPVGVTVGFRRVRVDELTSAACRLERACRAAGRHRLGSELRLPREVKRVVHDGVSFVIGTGSRRIGVGRVRQASKATVRAIAATTLPKISKVVGSATCATTMPARTAGSEREV
jgi:hypothetical protein